MNREYRKLYQNIESLGSGRRLKACIFKIQNAVTRDFPNTHTKSACGITESPLPFVFIPVSLYPYHSIYEYAVGVIIRPYFVRLPLQSPQSAQSL